MSDRVSEQERLPKEDAGPLLASSSKRPRLTYALACCVTYNLFANHWNRDSIGALELPLDEKATLWLELWDALEPLVALFTTAPSYPRRSWGGDPIDAEVARFRAAWVALWEPFGTAAMP